MFRQLRLPFKILLIFYLSLSHNVNAADEAVPSNGAVQKRGYTKGEAIPVSCLNRTIVILANMYAPHEEACIKPNDSIPITDDHGNLQYIPFPTCNETNQPLSFAYATPATQICTIDQLPDELYHLMEFFVHNDVPLTCRVPSYPLSNIYSNFPKSDSETGRSSEQDMWTPFTIALQGTLQYSHLHLHTNINVLFHTSHDPSTSKEPSYLIASTAYSLPNSTSPSYPSQGVKILRDEPVVLTFNVGWIEGNMLPGMIGRPVLKVTDHNVGFSLLSFFALAASAGIGAMGMLVYERRKSGRSGIYGNGILGGNIGNSMARSNGHGGYGGYGGFGSYGKKD